MRLLFRQRVVQLTILIGCLLACDTLFAEYSVLLRNGYRLRGNAQNLAGLDQTAMLAQAQGDDLMSYPILVIDDGLKRTFVHSRGMVREYNQIGDLIRRLEFWQDVARGSKEIAAIGAQTTATPFNADGRRFVTTMTGSGPIQVLQGITEINARYIKAEGLQTKFPYNWDCRISTSAIPAQTLNLFFAKQIDPKNIEARSDVLNFFIEAERFPEARETLKALIRDFPENAQLQDQFKALTQREAQQILREAQERRDAGQYRLAMAMLQQFIRVDGIARVTRLEAEDQLRELQQQTEVATQVLQQLRDQVTQLPPAQAAGLSDFIDTMEAEMTFDTLGRLSDYQRLGNDASITLEGRVALGVGGWLLGAASGLQNLAVARSLIDVRALVSQYLATEDPNERQAILDQLKQLEGAQPEYVSKLLALLPPPLPLPEKVLEAGEDPAGNGADPKQADPNEAQGTIPGYFEITVDTPQGPVEYGVQLPPEYHPLRKYPAILALHPIGLGPANAIQWWAGEYNQELGMRSGQAFRRGYVVIAPRWSAGGQSDYLFSQMEHHRVLAALRDCLRRVSIDTDRIYLSGHLAGATAAWDIGLAHPDLWAGLVCIGGTADKFIRFYDANSAYLPLYFVSGDMSATSSLVVNGSSLNDYMRPNRDAMVTMYRGRGDELFYEDINNIFDWMRLSSHRRGAPPTEIDAVTMRAGDQFFWWLELVDLIDNINVNPILFDHTEGKRAGSVRAKLTAENGIQILQAPSTRHRVLLSPEMGIDMSRPIPIRAGSRNTIYDFDNSIEFMLEDARQRADRQHVYWSAIEVP